MAGRPDPGRSVGGLERFWGEQRAQSWVSSGGAGWWGDWHLAPEGRRTESGGSYGWAQPCGEGCKVLDTSEGLRSGARGTPAGRPRADRSARSVAEADKSIRPGDRRGDFFPHGGWLAGRGVQRHPESLPAPNAPRLPGLPRPRAPHPRASHLAAPRVSPSAAPPARSRSLSLSPFSPPLSSCHPPLSSLLLALSLGSRGLAVPPQPPLECRFQLGIRIRPCPPRLPCPPTSVLRPPLLHLVWGAPKGSPLSPCLAPPRCCSHLSTLGIIILCAPPLHLHPHKTVVSAWRVKGGIRTVGEVQGVTFGGV